MQALTHVTSLIFLALVLAAGTAHGHHGWSANEEDIEVTGTVEQGVSLSGPHGTFEIRDADGRRWELTLAPGPRTHRAGLREGVIPVGAEVTVRGERNADPERHEMKVRRVTWEGQHFDVYPPRRD